MPEFSQEELDRLFRQGSEQYDFEYNPAAWEQMAAMLERSRRRRALLWWIGGVAAFLLLLGLALVFFLREEPSSEERQTTAGEAVVQDMAPLIGEKEEAALPPASLAGDPDTATKPSDTARPLPPPGPGQPEGKMPLGGEPEAATGINTQDIPDTAKTFLAVPSGKQGEEQAGKTEGRAVLPTDLITTSTHLPTLYPAGLALPLRDEVIRPPEWARRTPPIKPGASGSRLAFGLMVAGNRHASGFGQFSRSGWKAGAFLEYQHAGRLSLGLGANYLFMRYDAEGEDYKAPYGFWTDMVVPSATWGECTVLEAPLLLKYYFRDYRQPGLFATAGLSTYFMLTEEYWYDYEQPAPGLIRWWGTKNENQHWFSILHLAAGYQIMLGDGRLALQGAPYLQIPMSGIGHGQLKIYSIGLDVRLMLHSKK